MSQVQAAYTELLAAGNARPAPEQLMTLRARAPLTPDQLIEQLTQLQARHPEHGPRPVHLLNITNDGDGLITDIDRDCFDPVQGPVTSLLSGPLS